MGVQRETATLAGGCFWCLEAVFERLRGVESVVSGYSGGTLPNPSYEQVSSGRTGHAEAVQISYDPELISYRELLEVFFSMHDPTTQNRQGPDVGSQYRSAIFCHDSRQEAEARKVISELERQKIWGDPIITEVVRFDSFYPAEDYHQHYFDKQSEAPYCRAVITPKLAKLRRKYQGKLKDTAA